MAQPYAEQQWQTIDQLGFAVEERLQQLGVRLTMGGEPTFISADDFAAAEWQIAALGADKRRLAGQLLQKLAAQFAQGGGLLHYGQGKWYPGEVLPRWALGCYWRRDGVPIWQQEQWLVADEQSYQFTQADAVRFMQALVPQLGVDPLGIVSAYEAGGAIAGYVLPLLPVIKDTRLCWTTCQWDWVDRPALYLIAGDSPIGYRLPWAAIAPATELADEAVVPLDSKPAIASTTPLISPPNSIRVALCVEARQGIVHVFLPPLSAARSYLDLIHAIEQTAAETAIPVRLEGYTPPPDPGIVGFQITPDPGVIEANIQPAMDWQSLVEINTRLYQAAADCRLVTEKFTFDGRRVSTGGGAHITIGGRTTADSPLLRRPDLLRSIITYWQNHPGLSYLFADQFVGPTSQSPRVDEARHESLYELELAFQSLQPGQDVPPWLCDRLLRNLLIDVTGNTHRAEFCIDKLFPVENPRSQLGLLELRAIAMPPSPTMRLVQLLLVRALVAWFWERPYTRELIRWGTMLHDRFLLPHYISEDCKSVLVDLQQAGFHFAWDWFLPFLEWRFPKYGAVMVTTPIGAIELELRHAIEIWNVLGEEATSSGTARYVDASMERMQVMVRGAIANSPNQDSLCPRYVVTCNGHPLPLKSTGVTGEYVGAVRFRARPFAAQLHPSVDPHTPLRFEVVDTWAKRAIAACVYHVTRPDGSLYPTLPAHQPEAEARRAERFIPQPVHPEPIELSPLQICPEYPLTLDLRRRKRHVT